MKLPNAALKTYIDCYNTTNNEQIAEYILTIYEIDIRFSAYTSKGEVDGTNN